MYLLRHGQSDFNLHFTRTRRDPGIEDPHLTAAGRDQARAAGLALRTAGITRVIVSPYTRTLQTAALVLEGLADAPALLVEPLVRERYAFSCDIGRIRAVLAQDWPGHDFGLLPQHAWWPDGPEPESEAAVVARAERFRAAMRGDAAQGTTLLVSHWGFLLALTGQSMANGELAGWEPAMEAPRVLAWQ